MDKGGIGGGGSRVGAPSSEFCPVTPTAGSQGMGMGIGMGVETGLGVHWNAQVVPTKG